LRPRVNVRADPMKQLLPMDAVVGGHNASRCEMVSQGDDFLDLGRSKEPFDCVPAEVGQRWLVQVGFRQPPLGEEHLLNRTKKANLVGTVIAAGNVGLETARYDRFIVRDGVKLQPCRTKPRKPSRLSIRRPYALRITSGESWISPPRSSFWSTRSKSTSWSPVGSRP